MPYQLETQVRANRMELNGTVQVLADGAGARAEVWPALGFNCVRWQVAGKDQLYADGMLLDGAKPTRSGVPILFPFPNRIRAGHFTWDGKDYQLNLNDPAGKNAIHGFACYRPWRVVDRGTDATSAWITGAFHGASDAAAVRGLWPADYEIQMTIRLTAATLAFETVVRNPDTVPLPFGLGFHPYFAVPQALGKPIEECYVETPARDYWELEECLPTGWRKPLESAHDLSRGRRLNQLKLDDVLTGLDASPTGPHGLLRGKVRKPGGELRLWTSADFGELVVFTPPHRQAVCLEPYTCATDAINLRQKDIDSGLRVLPPGETWQGKVVFEVG